MFTKVYLLSETEFRTLVIDLLNEFKEEVEKDERTIERFAEFLENEFDLMVFQEENLDGIVVLSGNYSIEIYEPDDFVDEVFEWLGGEREVEKLLKD